MHDQYSFQWRERHTTPIARVCREMMEIIKVLFVCTGNICRSPTAEGVFRDVVRSQGLSDRIQTDSAGTERFHVGDPPDRRSAQAARQRGYDLDDLRARHIRSSDFAEFQLILAMDRGHFQALKRACPPDHQSRIRLFLDFADGFDGSDVPDPYYGDGSGFQLVLDMCEAGAGGLLTHIRQYLL